MAKSKQKKHGQRPKKNRVIHEYELKRLKSEWTRNATDTILAATLLTLYDKDGLEPEHLARIWHDTEKLLSEVIEGRVSAFDMKRTLEDELGIYILEREEQKKDG